MDLMMLLGTISARISADSEKMFDNPRLERQNCRFRVGGIPKRSTGSDCKSDGSAFEGSNPSPSTKNNVFGGQVYWLIVLRVDGFAGVAQW